MLNREKINQTHFDNLEYNENKHLKDNPPFNMFRPYGRKVVSNFNFGTYFDITYD